jgi:hypothetical protein
MAKMRRTDAKEALGRQRAQLRRGARGKSFVGQDAGSSAGRAAELERVRRLRERLAAERAREREARLHEEVLRTPISALLLDVAVDGARLAGTLLALPFRVAAILWQRHRGAEA